jgi:hypothetical protein
MFIVFLVSLVILLLAPKAADIIQSFLSGRPFEYGTAIGQAFGPITGTGGFIVGIGKEAITKGAIGAISPIAQRRIGRILRISEESPPEKAAETAEEIRR